MIPPTEASSNVCVYVEALRRLGYHTDDLIAAAGMQRADLNDPDGRISCSSVVALFQLAMQRRPLNNLGMRIAAETPIGAFPLVVSRSETSEYFTLWETPGSLVSRGGLVGTIRPRPPLSSTNPSGAQPTQVAGLVQDVSCTNFKLDRCEFVVTAIDPTIQGIRLLQKNDDPFSNVLGDTFRVSRVGWISWQDLKNQDNVSIVNSAGHTRLSTPTTLDNVVEGINKLPNIAARKHRLESLTLTSERAVGPVELRYIAGNPRTNILNAFVERKRDWGGLASGRRLLGIFFSAVMLSLGAPFWYDTLKNLLKLRPSLATKEEEQRRDRATEQPKPEPKP